jgi:hypothetical protein
MSKRLVALTAAAALLAFSAVPSFADHHGGGMAVVAVAGMAVVALGTAVAGMAGEAVGMAVAGTVVAVAGIIVVTAAAGELDPR